MIKSKSEKDVNHMLDRGEKGIWVNGSPGSGKSYLAKKIFEKRHDFCRIFVSGCNPEFRNRIIGVLTQVVRTLQLLEPSGKWLIILDEFDDESSLLKLIESQPDGLYYIVFSNHKCCVPFMKEYNIQVNNYKGKKQLLEKLDDNTLKYIKNNFNAGKLVFLEQYAGNKIDIESLKEIEKIYLRKKRELDQEHRKEKSNLIVCRCEREKIFFSAFLKEELK